MDIYNNPIILYTLSIFFFKTNEVIDLSYTNSILLVVNQIFYIDYGGKNNFFVKSNII